MVRLAREGNQLSECRRADRCQHIRLLATRLRTPAGSSFDNLERRAIAFRLHGAGLFETGIARLWRSSLLQVIAMVESPAR
jgi:hypothetical protein